MPLVEIPKRFKVVIGGRGSAKSETVGKLLAAEVEMKGYNVLAAREMMNSIADSVHALLSDTIVDNDMAGFHILSNEIRHDNGGGFIYRGLAKNPEGLKSTHKLHRAWIEEAQTISAHSLKLLTPSVRVEDSEIWFTGNPRSSKDAFSQRFIKPYEREIRSNGYYEDDMHLIIFINYDDNPWFPDTLEQERQFDYDHKPRALYNHIWLGHYDDSVERAIIQPEWFDACVDAHLKLKFEPRGIEVVSHDPSDTGSDSKGLAYRHGVVFKDVQENDDGDINEGGDWATDYAEKVKPDVFLWDGDGMGVGLRRQFNAAFEDKQISLQMFRGGHTPANPESYYEDGSDENKKTNRETFRNQRAQYYWLLRDRVWRTYQAVEHGKLTNPDDLISFSSNIKQLDLLRSEIGRIPQKPNPTGLIQIMSKDEMRRMEIASPNMADAVMMSLAAVAPRRHNRDEKYRPRRRGSWMSS